MTLIRPNLKHRRYSNVDYLKAKSSVGFRNTQPSREALHQKRFHSTTNAKETFASKMFCMSSPALLTTNVRALNWDV